MLSLGKSSISSSLRLLIKRDPALSGENKPLRYLDDDSESHALSSVAYRSYTPRVSAGHLEPEELERTVVTAGDLEFLMQVSESSLPSHTEIRLAAGVLRRLLVDGQLRRTWSSFEDALGPLEVSATDLDQALDDFETGWSREWLIHAWAGGGSWQGMPAQHSGFLLCSVPPGAWESYGSPDAFFAARGGVPEPRTRDFKLDELLKSSALAVRVNSRVWRISRQAVVQYVANRKGGVHFDPGRSLKPTAKNSKRRKLEQALILDHGLIRVGHLSGPEFEVACLCQFLARAPWTSRVIEIAHDVAPAEFEGSPDQLHFWSPEGKGKWETMTFGKSAQSPQGSVAD